MTKESAPTIILHSTEFVEIAGIKDVPAKIDTGADSSAIWASKIEMCPNGILKFSLFDEGSPLYTGEIIQSTDYTVKSIRSSHGDQQIRYQVKLEITICGQTFLTAFTLADRSQHHFPVLIGRRTIKNRFLVDVSKTKIKHTKKPESAKLKQELENNPYQFHQKYIERSK